MSTPYDAARARALAARERLLRMQLGIHNDIPDPASVTQSDPPAPSQVVGNSRTVAPGGGGGWTEDSAQHLDMSKLPSYDGSDAFIAPGIGKAIGGLLQSIPIPQTVTSSGAVLENLGDAVTDALEAANTTMLPDLPPVRQDLPLAGQLAAGAITGPYRSAQKFATPMNAAAMATLGKLPPQAADALRAQIQASLLQGGGRAVEGGVEHLAAGEPGAALGGALEAAGDVALLKTPGLGGRQEGPTRGGLSIDPFPDAPPEAFATGKRPEQIKTSRDRVGHMVSAIIDDAFGGDYNADPKAVHEAAVREFGPDAYVVTTGSKQKRITPEEGMALARRSQVQIQKAGGKPVGRETVDSYYYNEVGKQTQPWYHRGLDELKQKWSASLGDEGAKKAIDDSIRWENLYSANRGVDEAMDMGIRGLLQRHGFFGDYPTPMDVNTRKGQTPADSKGLAKTLEGDMVGGPKLGPFGQSKRAGVDPTKQPDMTVADRIQHGVYLDDTNISPTDATRNYVDARNRIGANRMYRAHDMEPGRPPEIQQRQARDWGGYQDIVKKNPDAGAISFAERADSRVDYYGGPDAVFRGDRAAFENSPFMQDVRSGKLDKRVKGNPSLTPRGESAPERRPAAGLMVAYHGSPYDFTSFDPEKIGTGEGAQAYGHGLYVAQNPHVANEYYNKLKEQGQGKSDMEFPRATREGVSVIITNRMARNYIEDNSYSLGATRAAMKQRWNYPNLGGAERAALRDAIKALDGVTELKPPPKDQGQRGGVYHVDVPDEHLADFLDLDKPMNQQPEIVAKLRGDRVPDAWLDSNRTGADLIHDLGNEGTPEDVSRYLESRGIKGNKYLDHNSRNYNQPGNEMVLVNGRPMGYGGNAQIPHEGENLAAEFLRKSRGDAKKALESFNQYNDDVLNPEHFSYDAEKPRTINEARAVLEEAALPDSTVQIKGGADFGTRNLVLFPNYAKSVKIVAKGGPVSAYNPPKPRVGLGIEHVGDEYTPIVNPKFRDDPAYIRSDIEDAVASVVRNRTTLGAIRAAANQLPLTIDDARRVANMSAENVARMVAARDASVTLDKRYAHAKNEWLKASASGDAAAMERAAEAKVEASRAMLEGLKVSADIARQAGLTLNAMRVRAVESTPLSQARKNLATLLEALESKKPEVAERVRQQIAAPDFDLSDPAQINKILRAENPKVASWADKIHEFRVSNVLWALPTQARNMLGNTTYTGLRPLREAVSGRPVEAVADAFAMAGTLPDAFRAWTHSMANEGSGGIKGEVEASRPPAIGGVHGKVIRTPLRTLNAVDVFFRTINAAGGSKAAAYRVARKEMKLGPADAWREANRMLDDKAERTKPRKILKNKSIEEYGEAMADEATNQQDLGPVGNAVLGWKGFRHIQLFRKTPMNLVKNGFWYSPAGALGIAKRALRGEYKGDPIGAREDAAKVAIGTAMAAMMYQYVQQGGVSGGGPIDKKERDEWMARGGRPYSVRIPGTDKRVSYLWLEPFGSLLGTIADYQEIQNYATADEDKKFWSAIVRSAGRNITEKTWLQGAVDFADFIADPVGEGKNFLASTVSSFVPGSAALAQWARIKDPYVRDAKGIVDKIKVKIPGLREDVLAKRDFYGEKVVSYEGARTKSGDYVSPLISPSVPSENNKKHSWVLDELERHGIPEPAPPMNREYKEDPAKTNKPRKFQVSPTDEERDYYTRYEGAYRRQQFENPKFKRDYKTADAQRQREMINDALNYSAKRAWQKLLEKMEKDGRLEQEWQADVKKRRALRSAPWNQINPQAATE